MGGTSLNKETVTHCLKILKRAQDQGQCSLEEGKAAQHLCYWLARLDIEDGSDSDDSLDAPSRALLADYRSSERFSRSHLSLGDLMGSSPSLRTSLHLRPLEEEIRTYEHPALRAELDQLADWSTFNVFRVRELSEGWPLTTVATAVMERFELIDKLELNKRKLTSFLKEIEGTYNDNPYHNSMHAADVTQSLGCLLSNDEFSKDLTDIELLSMIVAAAVHDVGHPGVSNDFLVNSLAQTAVEYNDLHVNENMHASLAFKIFLKPANNFLEEGPESQLFRYFRETVISIVLATDMADHEELMHDFQACIKLHGMSLSRWQPEKRARVMQLIVHSADIANPAKPVQFCTQWSQRVLQEFFQQGDREKKEGLPISPQCDREQVNCAKSQLVFLDRVVKPCYNAVKLIAPNSASVALQHVDKAKAHWEHILSRDANPPLENLQPSAMPSKKHF